MKDRHFAALAALLACAYALLQLRYLQSFLDYDQFVYLRNMLASYRLPFYNPHHLHFEMGGVWFHKLLQTWTAQSVFDDFTFHQRLRSILAATCGVFFSALYLRRACQSAAMALLGAACGAMAHGYLHYAAKVDTAIFPVAWLPLCLWHADRLYRNESHTFLGAAFLGLLLAIGALLHQALLLAAPALLLAWLAPLPARLRWRALSIERCNADNTLNIRWRRRLLAAALSAFCLLAGVSGAYYCAGRIHYNLPLDQPNIAQVRGTTWNGYTLQTWFFAYLNKESPFRPQQWNWRPLMMARGFSDALLSPPGPLPRYRREGPAPFAFAAPLDRQRLPYNLLAIFTLLVAALQLLLWRSCWRRFGRSWLALCLLLPSFLFFAGAIEPFYFEFWLLFCAVAIWISALCLACLQELARKLRLGALSAAPGAALLAAALLLSIHNLRYSLLPHAGAIYSEGLDRRRPEQVRYFSSEAIYRMRRSDHIRAFGPTPGQDR
ncbi:MAG: hypothetical protein K1X75_03060 [Leptospirales bacterium]|nr:hypothetical protein [Leptospirales bacterium]